MWTSFGDKRHIMNTTEYSPARKFKTDRISAILLLLWLILTMRWMTNMLNITDELWDIYIAYVSAAISAIFCTIAMIKFVKNSGEVDFQLITLAIISLATTLISVYYR